MTRYPLRRLRLRPGEEHREALRITLEPFAFGGEEYAASPPEAPAELFVQRASTGDVFGLRFATTVAGPCMRCLAPASVAVEVDAREYQATDAGADEELRSEYVVDGRARRRRRGRATRSRSSFPSRSSAVPTAPGSARCAGRT